MFLWPHARPCSTQVIASCLSLGITSFFLANEACGCSNSVANDKARPIVRKLFLARINDSPIYLYPRNSNKIRKQEMTRQARSSRTAIVGNRQFSVLAKPDPINSDRPELRGDTVRALP